MQSLEEMRLHSLNSALQAFVSLQDGVAEQFEGQTYTHTHSLSLVSLFVWLLSLFLAFFVSLYAFGV